MSPAPIPSRAIRWFAPLFAALAAPAPALASALPQAQEPEAPHVAYPERDALTPFREPTEIYAPPDQLYSLLRRMRGMAADRSLPKKIDERGREIVDTPAWNALLGKVRELGIDAGQLASVMRTSKNADDRRTAFYAMFYCDRVDYVINLIGHIPGEPIAETRQEALPRAVDYLRVHLGQRFGDLDDEQQQAILAELPEPGSPVAKANGIKRAPVASDQLYQLHVVPFIQLLNVGNDLDRAQALWFLKEVFKIRPDLATMWLEPALPRLRQLLASESGDVREQAIGLLQVIGPKDLAAPPTDDPAALQAWATTAIKGMFPPIRNLNDALIQLFPSEERQAIVAAGLAALENSAVGDPFAERQDDGRYLRGFRVAHVPEKLTPLCIPVGAVITAVNGIAVRDAQSLLATTRTFLEAGGTRKLLVEYVLDGQSHAVEYQVM